MIDDIGADHCDVGTIVLIVLVPHAAEGHVDVENRSHRWLHPSYPYVVDRLLTVLYVAGKVRERCADQGAPLAALKHGLVVLHREVLALLTFEQLIDVGDHRGHLTNDENIRAEIKDLLRYVSVDAIDERDHGDDCRHADHDTEQRQGRAQL